MDIADLFDRHQARLYRLALRMSGHQEDARDLVQETFFRVARTPGRVPGSASGEEAWLVRILVNLCRDRSRRERTRRVLAEEIRRDPSRSKPGDCGLVVQDAIRKGLVSLSPRRRAVLVLSELEDRTTAEIAKMLGVTRVTVRWHLAAARRDLKAVLVRLGFEPGRGGGK